MRMKFSRPMRLKSCAHQETISEQTRQAKIRNDAPIWQTNEYHKIPFLGQLPIVNNKQSGIIEPLLFA